MTLMRSVSNIHLLEANLNLLLTWFGPQGILKCTEQHTNSQITKAEIEKGQTAIDIACKKVCTFELICILQYISTNLDLNALACFDLMVEVCQNLLASAKLLT